MRTRLALRSSLTLSLVLGSLSAGAWPSANAAVLTNTVYLPNVTKMLGGADGWQTPFIVQNVGSATADVILEFFVFGDGSLVKTRQVQGLRPGNSFFHDPNSDTELPSNAQFSVVIRSYGSPVVSIVNEHQNIANPSRQEALSYRGLSAGATTLYAPYVVASTNGWLTTLIIQNLGTATATVTARFVATESGTVATLSRSIGPGRSQAIDPRFESALVAGEHAVTLTSTQPIGAVINAHNDAPGSLRPMGFSYNAVATVGPSTYLPYVLKVDRGSAGPGASRVVIQNVGTQPATPQLRFEKIGMSSPIVMIPAPDPVRAGGSWSFDPQIYKVSGGYQLCRNAPPGRCIDAGEYALTITGGTFAAVSATIGESLPGGGFSSNAAMGSAGASGGAQTLYLPNVTRTLGGASGWTTPIVLQSAGGTTAEVSWYRFADGSLAHRQIVSGLADGRAVIIDPRAEVALSDDTQYAVVITSTTGGFVAVVTERSLQGGDGEMAYEGLPAP